MEVHTHTLDVRDLEAIQQLPEQLPPEFQEVDILVRWAWALAWPAEPWLAS